MSTPRPGYSSHFGVANIPFGIASSQKHPSPSCVTRFEDSVIFLDENCCIFDEIQGLPTGIFAQDNLNAFAALSRSIQQAVRKSIQNVIHQDKELSGFVSSSKESISTVTMHLPMQVGDFTDFSCSLSHVQNAAEAMTGKRSIPPAFFHLPIGYAGRCTSLDISGTPVQRPLGQYWEGKPGESEVLFGPSKKMDFELELAAIVGKPIARNQRIFANQAQEHIFGYVLVNDWSARDIQGLEMIPLGPLNGKNAGTTISPWVVTSDALAPFRTAAPSRLRDVTAYLGGVENNGLDIELRCLIAPAGSAGYPGSMVCRSSSAWLYWTLDHCLAHQAIGGAGVRTGDLIASGTVSGEAEEEHGCLLEHMRLGRVSRRGYLEDGEIVTMTGFCGPGVGFGECVSMLIAAKDLQI